jgi:hypothetical protein
MGGLFKEFVGLPSNGTLTGIQRRKISEVISTGKASTGHIVPVELGREAVRKLSPGTELEFFKNPSTETERHTHRLHSVGTRGSGCLLCEGVPGVSRDNRTAID